jgi:putative spermidine/putrescine transport system permease protein
LTSILISTLTASLATAVGFMVSKTLAYHPRRPIFEILTYLPYAFSPVVYAYCLNFFFNKANLTGNTEGVVLAQFILTFPFAIILFLNHWNAEMKAVEQLTYTLGGSVFQVYQRVLLPMSKPILTLCFFQTFLISWFEYGLTSVIGLGKVPTLTIKVYQFIGESNIYFAALASCLLVFPPLILMWFNRKFVFNQS